MKKIININFQGRVIPIEESAYETLKQYVDSLRSYFANEEGRDEIINDIESRIAELFSERLKRVTACISDEDINAVIASIGRPQDFEEQVGSGESNTNKSESKQQTNYTSSASANPGRGRLYRNADDKIIGGVCSGLANYLGIDPVIMRIAFVLLIGALFWIYVILWIIVPSQSLQTNITKRIYRNSDDRVLAGVCGGLASYFNIDSWIPRLIFALPLIIGLISTTMNAIWLNWDFGFTPRIVTGSFSGTLFFTYIILWIAVPFASTTTEKLEMRGERVDLNSIRDAVKEDLETFRSKAEKWGHEVKQTAQQFGQNAGNQARAFATEAAPMARRARSGIGDVIVILFKAFFMIIAGAIALAIFAVLIGLLFGGMAAFPLKSFILEGPGQNMLAWCSLLFFLVVPLVGLITWLVRRIMGVRSTKHYLGFVFGGLWVIGIFCVIFLLASFGRNFKSQRSIKDDIAIAQPSTGKLLVDVKRSNLSYYDGDFFGFSLNEDVPVYGANMDTLMLNTVRVKIIKSKDSLYHASRTRISQANDNEGALKNAGNIRFNPEQQDSLLYLPEGFGVSNADKFRNQKVLFVIEVPVGKRIQLDDKLWHYHWFNMNWNNRRGWNRDYDDYDEESYRWDVNTEYIMTPDGLKKVKELDPVELKKGNYKVIEKKDDEEENRHDDYENSRNNKHYRYKQIEDSIKIKAKEQMREEMRIEDSIKREKKLKEAIKTSTTATAPEKEQGEEPLANEGYMVSPLLIFADIVR